MDKEHEFCLRCHRRLKKPEYRILGMGKICYEKSLLSKTQKPLFETVKKDADDKTSI